ncbi:MAG: ester cyclase [Actinobacteria bacterium]|nr:ester cyclase [Actinomycetota bacterium]
MTFDREVFDRAIDAFNRRDLDAYFNLYSPSAIFHGYGPEPWDRDRTRGLYSVMLAAFPDVRVTLDDFVQQGDRLAIRYTLRGTHRGAFMGVQPTGRPITMGAQAFFRVADGQVVERWQCRDVFGLLTQIGAVSLPSGTS